MKGKNKTKLSQLEKQFSDLAKDVSELRQTTAKDVEVDAEEVKSDLIVGEWYKSITGSIALFSKDEFLKGFTWDGIWSEKVIERKNITNENYRGYWTKSTPQEAQTALENEAKKRGFVEGAFFKDLHTKTIQKINYVNWQEDSKDLRSDRIGGCIYYGGSWAEIQQETIKEEEINWSVPQLLIYEKEERFVLMTNGISKDECFEAYVVLDEKKKSGWEIGRFSDKWVKDCFKPFKGELTIK